MLRSFLMLAAFFGFTGVALGAFAAHGLKNRLSAEYLAIFHTGVTYQPAARPGAVRRGIAGRAYSWPAGQLGGHLLYRRYPAVLGQSVCADPDRHQQARHHYAVWGLAFLLGWFFLGLTAWRLQVA